MQVIELIRQRFAALEAHDFTALYASYHPQAPFLEQFPSLAAYLDFAAQALSKLKLSERSEERRVGQECAEPCSSRWSPSP